MSDFNVAQNYPIAFPDTPVSTVNTGGGSGFNWGSLIQPLSTTATNILTSRYAVPQLNPGQVIQTPQGFMAQSSPGGILPTGLDLTGSGFGTMLLIGGGLLVVVLIASSRKN